MKWKPYILGKVVYDLSHLHPFEFVHVVAAKDNKPEQRYIFDVTFSHHCFTRSIKRDDHYTAEMTYSDSRETRLFDQRRYVLSKELPNIVHGIGRRKCFHTGHQNFFTVEHTNSNGDIEEYTIYFAVSRGSKKRLNFFVQSAYVHDNAPPRPKPRKPIKFSVIAYNTRAKKPIIPPPQ